MRTLSCVAVLILLLGPAAQGASLSYSYGTTNTTYHYRPLYITASESGEDIWKMTLWVPEEGYAQSHAVASAGEVAEFLDLQYGGTPFNYSPEGTTHTWSPGMLRMGGFQGDFDDTGGQQSAYYEFTKTYELTTDIVAVLTVRINAPVVVGGGYTTAITGSYEITNSSGATYDLWGCVDAGTGSLNLRHGGYTDWAFVNPDDSTSKPNVHDTDVTDGHQLYVVEDWYGSTVTSSILGYLGRMTVKENTLTEALNMRPGMTFELRADDMDFYYSDLANVMYGSTSVNSTNGVRSNLDRAKGVFGNGVDLDDGQSITMNWEATIEAPDPFECSLTYDSGQMIVGSRTIDYVDITAGHDSGDVWSMRVYRAVSDGHVYWTPGEVASFKDLQYGGTPFDYSPEVGSTWASAGLLRMSQFAGTFDDTGGQQSEYYEFTKTTDVAAGVTGELTVRIYAPTVSDGTDFETVVEGDYVVTNNSGSAYNLDAGAGAGYMRLALNEAGYTSWAFVNPNDNADPPNVHDTDVTDSHELYLVTDWYGNIQDSQDGALVKMEVKNNGDTASLNMRPGLTFELRADDMQLGYVKRTSGNLQAATTIDATNGCAGHCDGKREVFGGPGTTVPDGESVTMLYDFTISAPSVVGGNVPPVADAGDDFEVTDTDDDGSETVTLDGSGSSDSDGTIVSWVWKEGAVEIASGETAQVSLDVGVHTVTLVVTDDDDASDSDTVVVTVNAAPNNAPVADAGEDIEVTDTDGNGSETVTLDGSGSSDSDGTIVSWVWKEGAIEIATGETAQATLDVGIHTITLVVTDDDDATAADTVLVTVYEKPNDPPVADAGADIEVTDNDGSGAEIVTLDGSASSDSDGTIVSWVWKEGTTTLASGETVQVSFDVGVHTVTLEVTDDDDATDSDTVLVTVYEKPNEPPIADAGADQLVHDPDGGGETVTLDGSASYDNDGSIVAWVWKEGAVQIATGETAQALLTQGVHTITLVVTDDDSDTDDDTVQVEVNAVPVAAAGDDQEVTDTDGNGSETVTLNGSASYDTDGSIASWVWKEGAATIATGETAQATLDVGLHVITLEVTDDDGGSGTDTVNVNVLTPTTGTLSYSYGTTNTTYHYRPLYVTASLLGSDIWQMKIWVPEEGYAQSHPVASAGEIAAFSDLQYGGTPFNYSPEGSTHTWSPGMLRVGDYAGDFDDSGGQTSGYYEFTKTSTITTGITGTLALRINAPEVGETDFVTVIEASYTVTNSSGASYDLWACIQPGSASLNMAHGGYTSWAFVNPTDATAKPNVHATDVTDGHQLYTIYDWYGSTVTSAIPGFFARQVVKDNSETQALNMRPGLTFELRADDVDFYYVDQSDGMSGWTSVSSGNGVRCLLDRQKGVFGSGASLPDGQSITMTYLGTISTLPLLMPPIADAGPDQEVDDADLDGSETVTLDGSDSFDADGYLVSYIWKEGETTIATGETAEATFDVGQHVITLLVTDDDDLTDSDQVVINITSSAPTTYYVAQNDPNADDGNPGTEALPFETIAAAMSVLSAGDTVIIKEGIYRERVIVPVSGTEQLPITICGNTGDRVVVAGSDEITGWQALPEAMARGNPNYANIYYVDIDWEPERLYEDCAELQFAREPNAGWWFVGEGSDPTHIVDPVNLTQPDSGYWVGATMFFVNKTPVQDQRVLVTAYNPATHTVTLASEVATSGDTGPVAGEDTYYMFNKLELMDEAGDYCIEDLGGGQYRLYVWPSDSGSPSGHMYEGVRLTGTLFGWGSNDYITIDGLEIRHSGDGGTGIGTTGGGATDITIQNCVVHSNVYMGVRITGGTRIIVRNNVVTRNAYGVNATNNSTDVLISENDVSYNTVDGVLASYNTSNVYVERNYIHDHILWGHPDNMQTHNGVTNMWVEENVILNSGQTFMIEGTDGLHFINNMIVGSEAVMLHGGAANQELDGNTLAFSGYLMCSLGATGYDFTNNIFCKGHGAILYAATSTQNYTSDYNVFFHAPGLTQSVVEWDGVRPPFATYVATSGQDTHSYYEDPVFVNAPQFYERMYHYGVPYYTATKVYMDDNSLFAVGDHIEINFDGVVRTLTGVGSDANGEYLEFTPGTGKPLVLAGVVANWKMNTDYDLDLRVMTGSPAIGNGEGGRDIGSDLDISQYKAGDFDGDDVRDIPAWPPQ